jgi:hypothetical protein
MNPLLAFHVAAGTVGVLSGAGVLAVRKGTRLHRRIGLVFAVSMLAMAASGVVVAAVVRPSRLNVVAGLVTFYLVATGWAAGRRSPAGPGPFDRVAVVFAVAVGALALAFASVSGRATAVACLIFGLVVLLCAASDVRALASGGMTGTRRLARHLWRMGLALWIAVASLFLGQATVFPAVVRRAGLLPVPVLLVAAVMLYWLIRVRSTRGRAALAERKLA